MDPVEVGRELSEHAERTAAHQRRDRILSITEAAMLSVVAVIAAWSGYSAAKWGTESSVELARASSTRTKSSRADLQATQIRTLDSVSFNAAYVSHNAQAYRVTVRRLRPGYRPAFNAWVATHPLTNPRAPPGPAFMPQYHIAEGDQAKALERTADRDFDKGEHAGGNSDKYIRITVFLATVLFLVGISSHFPRTGGRYGLIGIASALLVVALVQLLSLPGPPT